MVAAGKKEIREWLKKGLEQGYKYMLVVYDRMGGPDDFDSPLYCQSAKDAKKALAGLEDDPLSEVMEVYDLSMNIEVQLAEKRAWHLPGHCRDGGETGDTNYSFATMMLEGTWPLFEDGDDPKKAAAHQLEKAVSLGHAESALRLGTMYAVGDGVEKDFGKANELLELAAKNDIVAAHELLCLFYWHGLGVEKDAARSAYWAIRASAFRTYCIEKARSIRENPNEAAESIFGYVCLKVAEEQGEPWAAPLLDELFKNGAMPVSREESERLISVANT
jgi:hypothetical protein